MRTFVSLLILLGLVSSAAQFPLISIHEIDASIQLEMAYAGPHNFVGSKIQGYLSAKCLLSRPAAIALSKAQNELRKFQLSLKLFDCYRPQKAVNHFSKWAKDLTDKKTKQVYYPNEPKSQLFKRGYIAHKSGHSRGSTVDLTLVSLVTGQELDMGTRFDYFDERSNTENALVGSNALKNRLLLKSTLEKFGFKNYKREWWHYTLIDEPFKQKYFDYDVQ